MVNRQSADGTIAFTARLARKHPALPVYVLLPHALVAPWGLKTTTLVEGTVNGHATGRRTIKRWDASPDADWFIEFTTPFCRGAGLVVGDTLDLRLAQASAELPAELLAMLAQHPSLRAQWDSLSGSGQRMAAEHIRAGKTEATRQRRACVLARQLQSGAN